MRPRAIQGVPGLNPKLDSFGRFRKFARMVLAVPKEEADKEMEGVAGEKRANRTKRKQNGERKEKTSDRGD